MIAAVLACGTPVMAGDIAPGGTLRAVYLGTNPAQAIRDPATGEVRGTYSNALRASPLKLFTS